MSPRFVSLHGIVVLLTVLFFQFLPLPEMLSWEELLLAKFLNQAPTLLCLGYILYHRKRVRDYLTFNLLIIFLILEISSEVHYYFLQSNSRFLLNIFNDILIYAILLATYNHQRIQLRESGIYSKKVSYAVLTCAIVAIGFSFPLVKVYQNYFDTNNLLFFMLLLSMSVIILAVGMSFFVNGPLSRSQYNLAMGTVGTVAVKIYLYLCIFVFDSYPVFAYTIGKIIYSMGILLIIDCIMKKCMGKKNNLAYMARKDARQHTNL